MSLKIGEEHANFLLYCFLKPGGKMELGAILKRFMERSPIPVMVRALLERVLNAERRNACFAPPPKKAIHKRIVVFLDV